VIREIVRNGERERNRERVI